MRSREEVQALLKGVLAKASAPECSAGYHRERSIATRFGDNAITQNMDGETEHVYFEASFGRRHADSVSNRLDDASLEELVRRVESVARVSPEDPESMLKQLIREMDENIINLRNESIKALATEKRFSRQIEATKKKIRTWQENSEKAVLDGNDKLARDALARKIQETQRLPDLEEQRSHAREAGATLKEQLRLLEDKVQEARRRKEILVARKRSAQSRQASAAAARSVGASGRG